MPSLSIFRLQTPLCENGFGFIPLKMCDRLEYGFFVGTLWTSLPHGRIVGGSKSQHMISPHDPHRRWIHTFWDPGHKASEWCGSNHVSGLRPVSRCENQPWHRGWSGPTHPQAKLIRSEMKEVRVLVQGHFKDASRLYHHASDATRTSKQRPWKLFENK